jgi:hypothetical protein
MAKGIGISRDFGLKWCTTEGYIVKFQCELRYDGHVLIFYSVVGRLRYQAEWQWAHLSNHTAPKTDGAQAVKYNFSKIVIT